MNNDPEYIETADEEHVIPEWTPPEFPTEKKDILAHIKAAEKLLKEREAEEAVRVEEADQDG